MNVFKKTLLATALVAALPAAAEVSVSGNVALSSDYYYRGVDQSGGPALSGGFDVDFGNGFYVGTWASSIGFSGGLEFDYYAGYSAEINEEWSYDVGYLFYGYPQGPSTEEFSEIYGSVSYTDFTLGFANSSDWYASTGSYTYIYADYSLALSEDYSLGFHYGTSSADAAANEYDDYSITLSTEAAGVAFDISWISTDIAAGAYADNEIVVTMSKSL